MRRSRLSVLVIFAAAMAACSMHDDSEGAAILSQDSTLVAHLEKDKQPQQALPDACGTVTLAVQPGDAGRREADDLTRKAYDAEMLGNVQEARALLRRATGIDATNKSAAYHLGLTSETLGDRAGAITAYCRYLTLTPTTAESVEARQRVAKLSQVQTRVAAGSVGEATPAPRRVSSTSARRVTRAARTLEPRAVASAPVGRSGSAAESERSTGSPSSSVPVAASPDVGSMADASTAGSDGATSQPAPSPDQPATTARTARRGMSRTQRAIIGAAAGAIIGGATGRSVKGAVIGAAAGGMLGTAVGSVRPLARGVGS